LTEHKDNMQLFFKRLMHNISASIRVADVGIVTNIYGTIWCSVQPKAKRTNGRAKPEINNVMVPKHIAPDLQIGSEVIIGFLDGDYANYNPGNEYYTNKSSQPHSENGAFVQGVLQL